MGFFNPVSLPKNSSNPVISMVIFGIPPPAHTFCPECPPNFALKKLKLIVFLHNFCVHFYDTITVPQCSGQ